MMTNTKTQKHTIIEDIIAISQAILIMALGIHFFEKAEIIAGGTTGLALLLSYTTTMGVGMLLFLINVPFYFIALLRVNFIFFVKTVATVALASVMVDNLYLFVELSIPNRLYGAIFAGVLCGVSILMLLRHNTSMGGFTIMVRYLQDRFGINGGKALLCTDASLMVLALYFTDLETVFYSTVSLGVVNLTIILNNKPGRYSIK